jgi:ATP phosphoribosyltransferase regulatory subunit
MVFKFLIKKERLGMQFRNITEELRVTKFRKNIEREIENYFESRGYCIIEPRVFQEYDDFILSNLRKDSSNTVKVLGGDSKIYVLRPDITTNILSQIFSKWEGEPPLKVYYNSKIYRNESRGKILQNYQMGVESLGDYASIADGEIVEMAVSIMSTLGENYILELGSSKFLDEFFKGIDINNEDELELRNFIAKKNRDSLRLKLESLKLQNTILDKIFDLQGDMREVIDMVKSCDINKEMRSALDSLVSLVELFDNKDIINRIKLDLSMVPDLGYYDGIIFKGYNLGTATKIISGGRYDKSTKKYGKKVPAIGFMIDMDLVTRIRIKEER